MSYGIKRSTADILFSKYIRTRDNFTCQRCGAKHAPNSFGLHASHYHSRAKKSVRFDPFNVHAHCHGCHSHFTKNPKLFDLWMEQKIGKKELELLNIRARTPQRQDEKMVAMWCREMLKRLES